MLSNRPIARAINSSPTSLDEWVFGLLQVECVGAATLWKISIESVVIAKVAEVILARV